MMKQFQVLSIIILAIFLNGCDGESQGTESVSFMEIPGVWKNRLTGDVLYVEDNQVSNYHSTKSSCILTQKARPIRDADAEYDALIPSVPIGLYMHIYRDEDNRTEDQVYEKQIGLSPRCESAKEESNLTNTEIFEHLWSTINDYYPFLDERDVEWEEQYHDYKAKVHDTMTSEEFFAVMSSMFAPINDGNVVLTSYGEADNKIFSPEQTTAWHRIAERLSIEEGVSHVRALSYLASTFNQKLGDTYATSDMAFIANGNISPAIAWGKLQGNVAYLQVNGFDGYADGSHDFSQELEAFTMRIDETLTELRGASSIILDLRFSRGGYHELALALASYFSGDTQTAYFTDSLYTPDPVNKIARTFPKSSFHFDKPLTLVMSASTQGAAELLALSLKSLPNVRIIGEQSSGALSPQFTVFLDDNWSLSIPYKAYFSRDTLRPYEALGIPVDMAMPSSSYYSVVLGMLHSIHEALDGMGVDLAMSDNMYRDQVEALMADGIPGFASALIAPSETSLYAFGEANIATGQAVTVHTPFKVGSISKTFIGTSAMQMREKGLLDLDWSLSDMSFPIGVDGVDVNNASITLRKLLTHTSGIVDSDDYACSYVIDEDGSSLYGAYGLYECPDVLTTDTRTFLEQYLQDGGAFYDLNQNFSTGELGEEGYQYSNIAASLAAEALHHLSDMPFEQWTKDYIFSPLGMNNTAWFNDDHWAVPPAYPYVLTDGELLAIPRYSLATWADGDLKTSVSDLASYFQAIINGGQGIISPESIEAMLSSQTDASFLEDQGIFWFNDGVVFGHSGGDPGTSAHMFYDQFNQVGYISMVNISGVGDESEEYIDEKFSILSYLSYRRALSIMKTAEAK